VIKAIIAFGEHEGLDTVCLASKIEKEPNKDLIKEILSSPYEHDSDWGDCFYLFMDENKNPDDLPSNCIMYCELELVEEKHTNYKGKEFSSHYLKIVSSTKLKDYNNFKEWDTLQKL